MRRILNQNGGLVSRLILKSWLCKWCPYRLWSPSEDDEFPEDQFFHSQGWHWCPKREDYIHNSMGCTERKFEFEFKRIPLAVRLGLKPNEQGEYLS